MTGLLGWLTRRRNRYHRRRPGRNTVHRGRSHAFH
jgi:hypothetical protein